MNYSLLNTTKAKRIIAASAKTLTMTTFGKESGLTAVEAKAIVIDHLTSNSKESILDFAKSRKVSVQ